MIEIKNICIAGMGLIGGSVAKAVKQNTGYTLLGIDNDPEVLTAAAKCGAADMVGGAELLKEADLLICALSPEITLEFLEKNAGLIKKGAVVTDVCGVKRRITPLCEKLCAEQGLHFIGGHPMAGREHSGFENSDGGLFQGASYILTPTGSTSAEAVAFMMEFARDIGCARVEITTPEHHDRMIAFTSQLPHVLAGSYVKSPEAPGHAGYSAGSFRDVSRVATVDERLWTSLFMENRDNLSAEISILIDNLSAYKTAMDSGDVKTLSRLIREGREIKNSLSR